MLYYLINIWFAIEYDFLRIQSCCFQLNSLSLMFLYFTLYIIVSEKKKKYFTHTFLVVVSYVTYFTYIFVVVWLSLSELMLVFFGFTLLLFGIHFDVWVFRFRLFDICFALSTLHTPPQIYFFCVLSCHHEISLWCF